MLQRLLHAAGLAALGSALLVLLGWASETTCHCLYQLLERRGVIERLIPGTVPSARRFSRQALSAFLLSTFPVLLLLGWNWDRLSAAARPSWNPLHASSFAYLVLVLHDTWFFFVHSYVHANKALYVHVHRLHHEEGPALGLHHTAHMDFVEALVFFFGFFGLVLATELWARGTWDPVAYALSFLVESGINMHGHSGYREPAWLVALMTAGAGLLPHSQGSLSHYIHHLDPRVNRGVYFTWWDRWLGTYRESHPSIRAMGPEEQLEYELRAFRMLYASAARRVREAGRPVTAWLKAVACSNSGAATGPP